MQFKSFPEIEYVTPTTVEMCRAQGLDKVPWCVTGKIDGSNFQVAIDVDGSIHYGGRNGELGRYDDYNNYRRAVANQDLEAKVRELKEHLDAYELLDIVKDGPYILICYFELCGGIYRHKDVPPVLEAVKIQGRVQYHPDNVVIGLDIFWYQPSTKDNGWLAPMTVNTYFNGVGLPHRKILATLSFDEAIQYPNAFEDTTASEMFGLPQITPNIAEGIVILPKLPAKFANGSRAILKSKNQIFYERGVKTNKVKHPSTPMSELDEQWFDTYMTFITESRMMSAISKVDVTKLTNKDFSVILKAFLDDADKDFNKEYGGQIKVLEGEKTLEEFNFMKVLKAAKQSAAAMIRPKFVEFLQQNKASELNESTDQGTKHS